MTRDHNILLAIIFK